MNRNINVNKNLMHMTRECSLSFIKLVRKFGVTNYTQYKKKFYASKCKTNYIYC